MTGIRAKIMSTEPQMISGEVNERASVNRSKREVSELERNVIPKRIVRNRFTKN